MHSVPALSIIWQLTQVLWVGGLWALHLGVLPAMAQVGVAPLLIDELGSQMAAYAVAFGAICLILQAVVLVLTQSVRRAFRDFRGQLVLVGGFFCLVYFGLTFRTVDVLPWRLFCYWALGLCGLLLVLQPVPCRARNART